MLKCKCIFFFFIPIRISIWNLFSCLTGIFSKVTLKQPDLGVSINMPFFENIWGRRQVAGKEDLRSGRCAWACALPVEGVRSRPMPKLPSPWGKPPVAESQEASLRIFSKAKFPPRTGTKLFRSLVYSGALIDNYFLIPLFQTSKCYFWHWLKLSR